MLLEDIKVTKLSPILIHPPHIYKNTAFLNCCTMGRLKRLQNMTKDMKTRSQARGANSVLRKREEVVQGTAKGSTTELHPLDRHAMSASPHRKK